jgi:hypothetical protein
LDVLVPVGSPVQTGDFLRKSVRLLDLANTEDREEEKIMSTGLLIYVTETSPPVLRIFDFPLSLFKEKGD